MEKSKPEIDTIPFDKEAHYEIVSGWWKFYYDGCIIPKDCLPDTGCIALKDGKPAGCSFVYQTNSKMATIHFSMAAPELGPTGRFQYMKAAVSGAIKIASEFTGNNGFVWGYTHNAGVARVFSQNGMKCVGEGDAYIMPMGRSDSEFLEEDTGE